MEDGKYYTTKKKKKLLLSPFPVVARESTYDILL